VREHGIRAYFGRFVKYPQLCEDGPWFCCVTYTERELKDLRGMDKKELDTCPDVSEKISLHQGYLYGERCKDSDISDMGGTLCRDRCKR
jgi:hypothetical protein